MKGFVFNEVDKFYGFFAIAAVCAHNEGYEASVATSGVLVIFVGFGGFSCRNSASQALGAAVSVGGCIRIGSRNINKDCFTR